jgi:uncharacterized protein (TIGR02118 family)
MIRVLVLYPRKENSKFDFDYYKNNHMVLVKKKLEPIKIEIDYGLVSNNKPSPFYAVSHMIFNSKEELASKYAKFGKELNTDKERFTNIEIITQVSEIIEM